MWDGLHNPGQTFVRLRYGCESASPKASRSRNTNGLYRPYIAMTTQSIRRAGFGAEMPRCPGRNNAPAIPPRRPSSIHITHRRSNSQPCTERVVLAICITRLGPTQYIWHVRLLAYNSLQNNISSILHICSHQIHPLSLHTSTLIAKR